MEFTGEARQQGADSIDPWGPEAVPHAATHGFTLEPSGMDENQQGMANGMAIMVDVDGVYGVYT